MCYIWVMTQTSPRPRTRITVGTLVTLKDNPAKLGEVAEPDVWYESLRLRGVGAAQQVLVEWESNRDDGTPDTYWERLVDLEPAR